MPRNSLKPKKKLKTHRGAHKRFKITANGKILRIKAKGISVQGRNTQGVRLLDTEEGDKVVSLAKVVEREEEKEPSLDKGTSEAEAGQDQQGA